MDYTVSEVMRFVEDNDVKFVKLAFCDGFGRLKNLSILASELPHAFEKGMAFNASGIDGFSDAAGDRLLLKPLPETLNVLPWRPHEGCVARLLCDVVNPDGSAYPGDTRVLLSAAVQQLAQAGYSCEIGSSCEFYLFKTDEYGHPSYEPQDYAGYLDASPLDKGENVRRDICLTLEQMGVEPETSHHERGPGQNEIDFKRSDALRAADDLTTLKSVVKAIAERNGVFASFMPKPLDEYCGSGMHIDFSLLRNNANITADSDGQLNEQSAAFMFGILKHIGEITLFANPYANSYERFGSADAPKSVSYSATDSSALLRLPLPGDNPKLVLRSPDPSCNHYLTFALLILAGLEGIKNNYTERDIDSSAELPHNLEEAVAAAQGSEFIKSALPECIINSYVTTKSHEWVLYSQSNDSKLTVKNSNFLMV